MKVSKQWRVSSDGPDWTDIRVYFLEIEKTHECTVYVGMQPVGGKNGYAWDVSVVAVLSRLGSDGKQVMVGMGGSFPDRDHKTVESLVFALLARLDYTIGSEVYVQSSFVN